MNNQALLKYFKIIFSCCIFCGALGCSLSGKKNSQFIYYTQMGDIGRVRSMLNEDASLINACDSDGNNAAAICAQWGWFEVLELLISNGIDLNISNIHGVTPLMIAVSVVGDRVKQDQIVETLILKGANVNQVDKNGVTALHMAATRGHISVTELLIKNHANINAKSNDGWTPLYQVLKNGLKNKTEIVSLLMRNGADSGALTQDGDSPLKLAKRLDKSLYEMVNMPKNSANR